MVEESQSEERWAKLMSKALEIVPLQDEIAHDDLGGLLVLGPQLLRHLGDVRVAGLAEHLRVRAAG